MRGKKSRGRFEFKTKNNQMKLTDLPSPYRELAEMRHEQKPSTDIFKETNDLDDAFLWHRTPEDGEFWTDVYEGKQPEIPKQSLEELEAWKKEKGDFNPTMLIEHPDHRLFTAACHAMQGLLSNSAVGNQIGNQDHIAKVSVEQAKAFLAELDKTKC